MSYNRRYILKVSPTGLEIVKQIFSEVSELKDATNYLNNLGKPNREQQFLLSVTYDELWAIKGLAQNPHDNYQDNPQLMEEAKNLFEGAKEILDRVNKRDTENTIDI